MDSSCEIISGIHLHIQQFHIHVSKRRENRLFLSGPSVIKSRQNISVSNSISLLFTHLQYTSPVITAFEVILPIRPTLTSNGGTVTHAVSCRTHNYYLPIMQVFFYLTDSQIVLQHYCFGEDYFGTYSTLIKLFWNKTTNFSILYEEVPITPWPDQERKKATAKNSKFIKK